MIPLISIVGRPNVGKSTLFNRLLARRKSIVFSEPGSTRDLIKERLEIDDKVFYIVDSGGFDNEKDHYPVLIKKKVLSTIKNSDLIIFMVDGQSGLQNEDREILNIIRKEKIDFITVINKIDDKKTDENKSEFFKLGIKDFIEISAEHDRNIGSIRDRLVGRFSSLKDENYDRNKIPQIAIVGKPNAGKSTLINSLAEQEVAMVSEIPGTTRDTVNLSIENKGKTYIFIDTAGLRRKSRVNEDVEYYSTSRAVGSIEKCDIVVLIIDAELGPTKQDLKIASLIKKNNKGIIIAVNKSDLIPEKLKNEAMIKKSLFEMLTEISYALVLVISALKSKNIDRLYNLIDSIYESQKSKINTNNLNKYLKALILKSTAPVNKGRRLKMYYATQSKSDVPSFILFCNFAKGIPNTYRRFIEKSIRNEFNLDGISLRVSYRTSRKE
jgi:GTP-binding protein|tara:strand:+ start:1628 stop:2944 length:1317 start_codon:yes stop_codon:yes gene_type:complete